MLSFRSFSLFLILLLTCFPALDADENTAWFKMLQGLKERYKYYDTALDYLERSKASPAFPDSLKEQWDYQVARIHLEAVHNNAIFLTPEEHLKRCRDSLEKYLKEHPAGVQAFDAQSTLGRLYIESGRLLMLQAEYSATPDAGRDSFRGQARAEFQKAIPYLEMAENTAKEQVRAKDNARKARASSVTEDDLLNTYGQFISSQMIRLIVKADIAKTFPKETAEFQKGLESTAKDFLALSKKYTEFHAPLGQEAKTLAAKTYKEAGQFAEAREILSEINVLQDAFFLKIKTDSLILTLEMALLEKTPEALKDAVGRVRSWFESATTVLKASREGQQILLLGAKNLVAYSENNVGTPSEGDKAKRDATIFLRQIRSTYPNLAREAQDLLRTIGAVQVNRDKPKDFSEAKEFADENWKAFATAHSALRNEPADDEKARLQAECGELANTAILSINRAVDMKEPETSAKDIVDLRYNLAQVYAGIGNSLEAAIIAEYIARNNPEVGGSDKIAGHAVRLWRRVYVEDRLNGIESSAMASKLSSLCDFISHHWTGSDAAGEVLLIQIETAIDNGDIEKAKKLLQKTTVGTPQYAAAELKIGQSLWNRYVSNLNLPENAEEKRDKTYLDAVLVEAKKQLELGLSLKKKLIEEDAGTVDAATVQSALVLAQIHLNADNPKDAILWLTDNAVGPLSDAMPEPFLKEIRLNAEMLALRAYVAIENFEKAEETMRTLENQYADEPRLTQIYVMLGRGLETRLKKLNETGEKDQAEKVAKSFELFLTKIKERDKAEQKTNSFQTLYWVAETFFRLGTGLSNDDNIPDEAKRYYEESAEVYAEILSRMTDDPAWAPFAATKMVEIRIAEASRCSEQYERAMSGIGRLLHEQENLVDLQIEAAKILEAWGRREPGKYALSLTGTTVDVKTGKSNVWGWNGVIRRLGQNIDQSPDLTPLYYGAHLSRFRCLLNQAKAEKDVAKKTSLLDRAYKDFGTFIQLRPELGGQEWYPQFDRIFTALDRERGNAKSGGMSELLRRMAEKKPNGPVDTPSSAISETPSPKDIAVNSSQRNIVLGGTIFILAVMACFFLFRRMK